MSSIPLPLALLLLCRSLLHAPAVTADSPSYTQCPGDSNYTSGSAFQRNLDALLSSLPGAAAASSGFAMNTTGAAPDTAYGLAQCRADVNASDCLACLDGSLQDRASMCPGQKSGMLFYDRCLLRHSDASFFDRVDTSWVWGLVSPQNATHPQQFTPLLGELMRNITKKAAYESLLLFAVGSIPLPPFLNIYGLVQCTRDLSNENCDACLAGAIRSLPSCCDSREGAQLLYRSCYIRYEVAPFYDARTAEAAMSTPLPTPAGGHANTTDHSGGGSNGRNQGISIPIIVSIPVAVALLVLLLVIVYLCRRNTKPKEQVLQIASLGHEPEQEMRSPVSLAYDLSTIRAATNNFSEANKIGEGGFGPVYKGILQNGVEIAVKRLSATSQQGHVEMKNEVVLVANLQHKNLVRLLGYCVEEGETLLVYEFLSNSSLDKILFGPALRLELSWGQRHKIIRGIARGLLYLHEDSRLTIIHRDLKASNILLDAELNPKISDFGLAKLFNMDYSMGNTSHIAGTFGYMAPEYALQGIFSVKSDVFSYGVLVLEIVTGRRNMFTQDSGAAEDLVSFVWRHWSLGCVAQLLDACPVDGPPQEILRSIHVGLLCLQKEPLLRPGMASVVVMLNSNSATLPAPSEPAYAATGCLLPPVSEARWSSADCKEPRAAAREQSINDVSVSELEPR